MLNKRVGIDLGSASVVVFVRGEGVVLNEPAVVATDEQGVRVLGIGRSALDHAARRPEVRIVRPLQSGNVIDARVAGALLQHVVARVCGRQRIFRPDVMVAIRPQATGVERRAILEASIRAGARSAYLIDVPHAAALGADLPLSGAQELAVCDIGAETIEAAVFSYGEMVAAESAGWGSDRLDLAISAAMAEGHRLRITQVVAQQLKHELGTAVDPNGASIEVEGQDNRDQPQRYRISAPEVSKALDGGLAELAELLRHLMAQVPTELRDHLQRTGLVLTGGGAQLRGLAVYLQDRLGLPVRLARNAQTAVAAGTALALDNMSVIRRGQQYIS